MIGYLAQPSSYGLAGAHTQKEAGLVGELLLWEGLRRGFSVLKDGSLRDGEWYAAFITAVRRRHPALRVALLHMTCLPEMVVARAAKRAEATGRVVPPGVLMRAMAEVPRAVAALAPLTDYAVTIDTTCAEPVLASQNLAVPDGAPFETWDSFAAQWRA